MLDSIFGGLPANLSPQEIVNAVVPQAVRDTIAQAFASGPAVAADVLGVPFDDGPSRGRSGRSRRLRRGVPTPMAQPLRHRHPVRVRVPERGVALPRGGPGLGTFATQNRYARLGIVVMVGLSVLFLIAAGYDLRRLEYEWKFSKQDAPDDGEDRRTAGRWRCWPSRRCSWSR
ncbi:MAG: hypothetical protein U5J98_06955 [Halobacteriales archaeon]|nr:hypothetical protein [Halobacteriales archaeon]